MGSFKKKLAVVILVVYVFGVDTSVGLWCCGLFVTGVACLAR